jgi:hypothetical protein
MPFALPPVEEQRRIAEMLWALLGQSNSLDSAQQKAKAEVRKRLSHSALRAQS